MIFKKFLTSIGYFQEFPITREKTASKNFEDDPLESVIQPIEEEKYIEEQNEKVKNCWKNTLLVIIPTRLGLNRVNKEYFTPITNFF